MVDLLAGVKGLVIGTGYAINGYITKKDRREFKLEEVVETAIYGAIAGFLANGLGMNVDLFAIQDVVATLGLTYLVRKFAKKVADKIKKALE